MKIAVLSDVHGNLTAFQAVLLDIERQQPDYTVFAGDLCVFGARPADTLALIRENQHIISLYGNTDEMILQPPILSEDLNKTQREHLNFKLDSVNWVKDQLSEDDLRWLQKLPFGHRFSPTPNPKDDLLILHANPIDVHQYIFPTEEAQRNKLGDVPFKQTPENLAHMLSGVEANVIAFGHIHFPNIRQWQKLTLANISSVSNPMDGDVHAKYGLLTWDATKHWQIEIKHIVYDIQQEQAELAVRRPPKWETLSRVLDGELFLG
jgi:predicted phosphodiesterase